MVGAVASESPLQKGLSKANLEVLARMEPQELLKCPLREAEGQYWPNLTQYLKQLNRIEKSILDNRLPEWLLALLLMSLFQEPSSVIQMRIAEECRSSRNVMTPYCYKCSNNKEKGQSWNSNKLP